MRESTAYELWAIAPSEHLRACVTTSLLITGIGDSASGVRRYVGDGTETASSPGREEEKIDAAGCSADEADG